MTTYMIATLGDWLIATASTAELLRERAELEIESAGLDATWDDLDVTEGLRLIPEGEEIEDGADVVWLGGSQGWLQDDEGRSIYRAAVRV